MADQTKGELVIDKSQYKGDTGRTCYHIKADMLHLRKWGQDGIKIYLGIYYHPMLDQYRFTCPIFIDDNNLVYTITGMHEYLGQGDLVATGRLK
jgi:hypothetical protein